MNTVEELQSKLDRIKAISTDDGFEAAVNNLYGFLSREEAFEQVNDEYFNLIGVYRFKSYDSWRTSIYNKSKRKKMNCSSKK